MTAEGPNPGVPMAARVFQGRRAGIVSRSAAAAVDSAVVAMAVIGTYVGFAVLLALWSPRHAHLPVVTRPSIVVFAMVLAVAYLTASWATGRTYGDRLLGLRVVDSSGVPLRTVRALLRAVVCVAFPLGLLWAALSRSHRSVADLLARTAVVYDWPGGAPFRPASVSSTTGDDADVSAAHPAGTTTRSRRRTP